GNVRSAPTFGQVQNADVTLALPVPGYRHTAGGRSAVQRVLQVAKRSNGEIVDAHKPIAGAQIEPGRRGAGSDPVEPVAAVHLEGQANVLRQGINPEFLWP